MLGEHAGNAPWVGKAVSPLQGDGSRFSSRHSPVLHRRFLNCGADFTWQPLFPPLSVSYLGSFSTWSSDHLGLCIEQTQSGGGCWRKGWNETISKVPSNANHFMIREFCCFLAKPPPRNHVQTLLSFVHFPWSWLGLFRGDTAREKWDNPGCGGRRGAQAGAAAGV